MANRLVIAISATILILLMSTLMFDTTSSPLRYPAWGKQTPGRELNERLAHAEALWRQDVNNRALMAAETGINRPFPDGYIDPYHVWDFARPSYYCPHDTERVGSLGDGGKVVCGMVQYEKTCPGPSSDTNEAPELIVYSFGVKDDSSFEQAMLERTNAVIYGYDYSVSRWGPQIRPHQYSRASFNRLGIGKVTDKNADPPMIAVYDLMKENGHSWVDIVKMDIEGAEFDALTSVIQAVQEDPSANGNDTLPIGQLLLEVHFLPEPPGFAIPSTLGQWMNWFSSLEDMGLRPVNNEDNWVGDAAYGKPRFMEYTMINVRNREQNKLLWEHS